ncbi:MAG: LPS export ABC transporter periplasmic protein LptC [Sphingorhabdus sp.]|nr:LPS export ABC transporter periplasmic protein LptC [Sphingorhabdus sp.]
MSEQADKERTLRQFFAAPGGRHDRLVRILRVGLPSIIGVLVAMLVVSPFSNTQEMSFVLAKDEVNMAKERMRLTNAMYRGEDSRGRPFTLRGGSAVQKSSAEPIIRLTDLSGQILMANGPAQLVAGQGSYNLETEKVRVEGPLSYTGGDGFSLTANSVEFAMKTRQIESFGPVNGAMKVGTFSAGKLRADVDARIVRLEGGAHLRINQNAIR